MKKKRLDQLALERGLGENLKEVRSMILAGRLLVDDQKVEKAGTEIPVDSVLRVKGEKKKYVSRAGLKLEGALEDLKLSVEGWKVLDVGASTGGFTDCCLQRGASLVVALDVGTNQLDWKLRNDDRVVVVEKTHVRDFSSSDGFDLVTADLSFISLASLAGHFKRLVDQKTDLLVLVKPQFELPANLVPEGGVVTDAELRQHAINLVVDAFQKVGLSLIEKCDSRLSGREGNVETFVLFRSS